MLRAESCASPPGTSPGPMTDAVRESHRRALVLAQQATTARVCALERYAEQVRVTDAARLDWQSALKIAGLNDRYLDLLARTAADDQAIAEIAALTGQASAADEAFRESLRRATMAAGSSSFPWTTSARDRVLPRALASRRRCPLTGRTEAVHPDGGRCQGTARATMAAWRGGSGQPTRLR